MAKWILFFIFFQSCTVVKNNFENAPTFDRQGHRGCRGLQPENTIAAMLLALESYSVNTLELDVVITADSKVVLSHEPFMNHEIATKPDGSFISEAEERNFNLYKMTYDSVKQYDVGLRPHPRFPQQEKKAATKPLLSDVFDAVKKYCKDNNKPMPWFNIETKSMPLTDDIYHPKPNIFVDLLMEVVNNSNMTGYVNIQSFDFRTLQYAHKKYKKIPLAALVEDSDKLAIDQQIEKLGFIPQIYSPHYSIVNKALVDYCNARGIKLIPWTVNDKKKIEELKALGVNGIITDYPNLFD
jgi:glycerophosphoryl diester phosphodiesterase